ncbi:MAG: pyridoxamine 5'-phosphate oxidase family protein [Burkholderiaceae bacterium]
MKTSPEPTLYHEGSRHWQDRFDSRRLADRIEQVLVRESLTDADREFVSRQSMCFVASVGPRGQPDVSYKGGRPGFVRVIDEHTLAWPHYDGNGMFLTLGNLRCHSAVALLFIDFEQASRLRVQGRASVDSDDALLASFEGAQLVVRIGVERVFPNCPRYIDRWQRIETSPFVPAAGCVAPTPAWKQRFRDVLPAGDAARE